MGQPGKSRDPHHQGWRELWGALCKGWVQFWPCGRKPSRSALPPDLHEEQRREPHQPPAHGLRHHRAPLLHRYQGKVGEAMGWGARAERGPGKDFKAPKTWHTLEGSHSLLPSSFSAFSKIADFYSFLNGSSSSAPPPCALLNFLVL